LRPKLIKQNCTIESERCGDAADMTARIRIASAGREIIGLNGLQQRRSDASLIA
jgi:hypothetical protein